MSINPKLLPKCFGGKTRSQSVKNGLKAISEILGCKPNEVFGGQTLKNIEQEFIKDPIKETQCIYHDRNPNKVYLKMEGWFTADEVSRFLIYAIDGISGGNKH